MKKIVLMMVAVCAAFAAQAQCTCPDDSHQYPDGTFQWSVDGETWNNFLNVIPESDFQCLTHHDAIECGFHFVGSAGITYGDVLKYPGFYWRKGDVQQFVPMSKLWVFTNYYTGAIPSDYASAGSAFSEFAEDNALLYLQFDRALSNAAGSVMAIVAPCYDHLEGIATSVTQVQRDKAAAGEVIVEDGQLVIAVGDDRYNLNGQKVK